MSLRFTLPAVSHVLRTVDSATRASISAALPALLILSFATVSALGQESGTPKPSDPKAKGSESGDSELAEDLAGIHSLLDQGEYGEAEEYLADMEGEPAADFLWARLYRETGRGEKAKEHLVASEAFRKGDVEVWVAVAAQDQFRGRLEEAATRLRKVLETENDHVEARARLGQVLVDLGRTDEGHAEFSRLVEFYKKLSTPQARALGSTGFVWLGKSCEGLNRFKEALKVMYSSALDLDKDSIEGHLASGWALLSKYNYPDSRSHFKDALAINPEHAEANIGLAYATYADYGVPGNRFAQTESALSAALSVWPEHPDALVLRGHLAFYDENWPRALDYYQRAVAVNPSRLDYRAHVAVLYYATNREEDLAKCTAAVEKQHPKPAPYFSTMAERLTERFFYEEAANFARKAVEIDPEYWPAYLTLGVNALRVGNDAEGKLYVEKAFQNDKFNIWAFNTRILIRHLERNFVETKTKDFLFRFHEEDEPFLLPYLRPLMESAKKRMEEKYKLDVSEPIIFEDFSDHAYFSARSIGLPGLAASGVCFGKMVTLTTPRAIPGNWGAVAIHEFAHVVALQKTQHRVPRWLTEGLSTFEESSESPRWARLFADEFVEAIEHDGLLPLERLPSGFTKPDGPQRILLSYYQGGMICQFITERFGFEKIVQMLDRYRAGEQTEPIIQAVFGWSYRDFDREFLAWGREQAQKMGLGPRVPPSQITPLRFAAQDDPTSVDRWVRLGFAYYFSEKLADAELVIGKALKLGKPSGDLEALRGLIKVQQRRTGAARAHFKQALELGTRYRYRSQLGLAMSAKSRNDNDAAIEYFQAAIETHPMGVKPRFGSSQNPYYHLSELLLAADREEEALAVLEKLLAMDRDDAKVRKQVAKFYRTREDWPRVVDSLWDAVYIDPYDFETHGLLAEAFQKTQAWEKALVELEILQLDENPALDRIYGSMATCYLELERPNRARELAAKALEINSKEEQSLAVIKRLGE